MPTARTGQNAEESDAHRARWWIPLLSTLLLGLAALGTAWAGYQASRWHGEQAKNFATASAVRVESARASGLANRQVQIDVAVYIQWVDAYLHGDARLAGFYRRRFQERFKPAFDAWIATRPFTNPDAPLTPFELPQYRLAANEEADRLEARATASSEEGREDIQRADDYVLAVVLFAASLFFAGISGRVASPTAEVAILGLGCALFLGTAIWLATFPVTVAV
jgi:hypothetical protein